MYIYIYIYIYRKQLENTKHLDNRENKDMTTDTLAELIVEFLVELTDIVLKNN